MEVWKPGGDVGLWVGRRDGVKEQDLPTELPLKQERPQD